jgi:hypothetical protein
MTFTQWLKSLTGRPGATGDLARMAAADAGAPQGDARYAHWREYLEDKRATPPAFRALEEVWREYSALP